MSHLDNRRMIRREEHEDFIQRDILETQDAREEDRCLYCNVLLSGNCAVRDDTWPYCSAICAIDAEEER